MYSRIHHSYENNLGNGIVYPRPRVPLGLAEKETKQNWNQSRNDTTVEGGPRY